MAGDDFLVMLCNINVKDFFFLLKMRGQAMVLSDDKILCTGSVITNKEILLPASCALNEKA